MKKLMLLGVMATMVIVAAPALGQVSEGFPRAA